MSAYTKMSGKFFVRLPLVSVKLSAKGMGHRSAIRNQEFETSTCPIFVEICRYRQLLLT